MLVKIKSWIVCLSRLLLLHTLSSAVNKKEPYAHQVSVCRGHMRSITCPNLELLHIYNAFYGKLSGHDCEASITQFRDQMPTCFSKDAPTIIRQTCQNQQSCDIYAEDSLYNNPCPSVNKYLFVSFTCQGKSRLNDILKMFQRQQAQRRQFLVREEQREKQKRQQLQMIQQLQQKRQQQQQQRQQQQRQQQQLQQQQPQQRQQQSQQPQQRQQQPQQPQQRQQPQQLQKTFGQLSRMKELQMPPLLRASVPARPANMAQRPIGGRSMKAELRNTPYVAGLYNNPYNTRGIVWRRSVPDYAHFYPENPYGFYANNKCDNCDGNCRNYLCYGCGGCLEPPPEHQTYLLDYQRQDAGFHDAFENSGMLLSGLVIKPFPKYRKWQLPKLKVKVKKHSNVEAFFKIEDRGGFKKKSDIERREKKSPIVNKNKNKNRIRKSIKKHRRDIKVKRASNLFGMT